MKLTKWVTLAFQIVAMAIAVAAAYMIITMLSADTGFVDVLSMAPYYLVFGGALFALIMGISVYRTYLPLCISFGSRRRDALVGLQLLEHMPPMVLILLAAACCMLLDNAVTRAFLSLWLPMFFIMQAAGAVGGLAGCLTVRFGKTGTLVATLAMMLCGLSGGFVGGVAAAGGFAGRFGSFSGTAAFITGGIAAVLWAAELVVARRITGKFEVRL